MSDDDRSPDNLKRSRNYNDYESDDDRQQRSKRRYNDRMELRLMIQSRDAGSIIGRGGDNIKRLREDYKVGITVSDSRAPERIVIITGELNGIGSVVEEIIKGFDDKFKSRRDQEAELKMLIHQSQAGCVIGKAGSKLKEFRQDHDIDIKVFPECCPRSTDRTVQVTGTAHNVQKCITSIMDMLKTWPPKGMNNQYDPINYMESAVRDYGGYFDDFGGRGGGGGGGGGGRGRDRDRGGSSRGSGFGASGSRDRGGLGSLSSASSGPRSAQQVSIPSDLAGIIIGKSGQNIKRIRQESGADVELNDASDGGSDRVITITGTADQIQNAQYLLQLSVKQHLARN